MNFPPLKKVCLSTPMDGDESITMKERALLGFSSLVVALIFLGCSSLPEQRTDSSRPGKPKRLLVVTTTTGFRHSSIETGEKILAQLGQQSGAFTVDYVRVTPPKALSKPTPPQQDPDAEKSKAEQEKYYAAVD